jgi:hypothetical protein
VASGNGTLASKDAGAQALASFGSLALGGAAASDYTLAGASGSVTVNPLPVGLSGSRTYDGTTGADAAILTITNRIGSDDVSVAAGTGVLAAKDIGAQLIVAVGSLTLGGTVAGDYTVSGATGAVTISPKALTSTGLSAGSKCYDGTNTATLSGTAALLAAEDPGTGDSRDGQPFTGDDVSVTGTPSGTFAQSDAGAGVPVTVSGLSLSGAAQTNYSLSAITGLSADIFAPPDTSAITGPNSANANQPGVIYSVTATPGSTYGWSVPFGAAITAGQGSASITVTFGGDSGDVAVVETNANGCSGSQVTLAVTVNAVQVQPANAVYGPVLSSGNVLVRFEGTPGITYTVQFAPAVTGPWSKATNITAPTDNSQGYGVGVFQFTEPFSNSVEQRYYRTVYHAY